MVDSQEVHRTRPQQRYQKPLRVSIQILRTGSTKAEVHCESSEKQRRASIGRQVRIRRQRFRFHQLSSQLSDSLGSKPSARDRLHKYVSMIPERVQTFLSTSLSRRPLRRHQSSSGESRCPDGGTPHNLTTDYVTHEG